MWLALMIDGLGANRMFEFGEGGASGLRSPTASPGADPSGEIRRRRTEPDARVHRRAAEKADGRIVRTRVHAGSRQDGQTLRQRAAAGIGNLGMAQVGRAAPSNATPDPASASRRTAAQTTPPRTAPDCRSHSDVSWSSLRQWSQTNIRAPLSRPDFRIMAPKLRGQAAHISKSIDFL